MSVQTHNSEEHKCSASLIFHTKAVDDSACQTLNMKKGFIKWVHVILLKSSESICEVYPTQNTIREILTSNLPLVQ